MSGPEKNPGLFYKGNEEGGGEEEKCPECDNEQLPCDKCSLVAMGGMAASKKPVADPCGLFGVLEDDEIGDHLVALKDIPAGTILWRERPLVSAPSNPNFEIFSSGGASTTCAGCHSLMPTDSVVKCSKCDWLVCGKECEEISDHKLSECANNVAFSLDSGMGAAFSTLAYRITLLKKRDPEKYADLMKMKDDVVTNFEPHLNFIIQLKLRSEMKYLKIDSTISPQEYEKILRVILLNSLRLVDYYENQRGRERLGFGIYKKQSLMAHSCIPNCCLQIEPPPSHEMRVHAAILIKKGERLTICTLESQGGLDYLSGVAERQRALQKGNLQYFRCKCGLCSDPAEMGTNLSTLVCQKCKNLSMLPLNPGAQALGGNFDNWEWKCTTKGCLATVKNAEIKELNETILATTNTPPMTARDFAAASNRWIQLKTGFKDKVGPNYWAIVTAARNLCEQYCHMYKPPMDSPEWRHHLEIMLYLLKIFDVIRPGISIDRARLQYSIMMEWCAEFHKKPNQEDISVSMNKAQDIIEIGNEALKYFKLDPKSEVFKNIQQLVGWCEEARSHIRLLLDANALMQRLAMENNF